MTKQPLSNEEITRLITGLNALARNLWWTWDQEAQEVFSELSPRGWQNLYHNAVAILREVSEPELRARLQDPDFAERVREVLKAFDAYMHDKLTWAQQHAPALASNPAITRTCRFLAVAAAVSAPKPSVSHGSDCQLRSSRDPPRST